MPRAPRVCLQPDCPTLTAEGYCAEHQRARDAARGRRQARGYGPTYDADRRDWAAKVDAGGVRCWRCQQPMVPGEPWHLGHDDTNRAIIRGPEHPTCNLSAAGAKGAAARAAASQ